MSHKYKSLLLNMPVRHIISKVAMLMAIWMITMMIHLVGNIRGHHLTK